MKNTENLDLIRNNIRSYPDFPKAGILFRDIFSLTKNPDALQALNEVVLEYIKNLSPKPDLVIGLEARGFLLGPLITLQAGIPFVPIRKRGKLPGKIKQQHYKLEYGEDIMEIQADSVQYGQNILIVDDLLATGGSLQAACKLVNQCGAKVQECLVVMELEELKGRESLDVPIHSIIQL